MKRIAFLRSVSMLSGMEIHNFAPEHYPAIQAIYQQGIDYGHATFEQSVKSYEAWNKSFLPHCRLVATDNEQVIGWAALSATSARPVYAGVTELSIYIADNARGKGVGNALMEAIILQSEQAGIWTLQSSIFPENLASLALHKKHGFVEVGLREKIGQMNGWWRDVILLERRSPVVGQT